MLALAKHCDIRVPPYRIETVGSLRVLLVQRFDRSAVDDSSTRYYRARMVSALTVLDADETINRNRWSYLLLSDELQKWSCRPKHDRAELFRRMVFNALVTNSDDHPRNHALLAVTDDWRLSPAYDLTPSPTHSYERDLAMICGTVGRRATRPNLVSGCGRFGLGREEAEATIDQMRTIVTTRWEKEVLSHGGSLADCVAIRPAFDLGGFDAE